MAADKKYIDNKKELPDTGKPGQAERKLAEKYFSAYAACHQNATNRIISYICIPLLMFSLFGLIWAIPFPHLNFLGKYNGYFNWASFVIAAAIYYYLKLSPLISYLVLFILLGFSYIIMELLAWQTSGGPAMWLVCLLIFIPALVALRIGQNSEGKKGQSFIDVVSLAVAPAYLLHLVLKKLSVKY